MACLAVKSLIQIPCLNEEATLPAALATIPREVPDADDVEIRVIDGGSTLKCVQNARMKVTGVSLEPGSWFWV